MDAIKGVSDVSSPVKNSPLVKFMQWNVVATAAAKQTQQPCSGLSTSGITDVFFQREKLPPPPVKFIHAAGALLMTSTNVPHVICTK